MSMGQGNGMRGRRMGWKTSGKCPRRSYFRSFTHFLETPHPAFRFNDICDQRTNGNKPGPLGRALNI